ECSDSSGYLQLLCDSGDEKNSAKGGQQNNLVGFMLYKSAESLPESHRRKKYGAYGHYRDTNGQNKPLRCSSSDEHRNQRQIYGHRHVFQNQYRKDDRCFRKIHPTKFGEHLGNHSGGGDIGNAAKKHGGHRLPSQHQAEDPSRSEIQKEVNNTGGKSAAQSIRELVASVFQPQHKQEQQ